VNLLIHAKEDASWKPVASILMECSYHLLDGMTHWVAY
jgi:hypothetical protein